MPECSLSGGYVDIGIIYDQHIHDMANVNEAVVGSGSLYLLLLVVILSHVLCQNPKSHGTGSSVISFTMMALCTSPKKQLGNMKDDTRTLVD